MSTDDLFKEMRAAADSWAAGLIDGNALHSAVADYTDSVYGSGRNVGAGGLGTKRVGVSRVVEPEGKGLRSHPDVASATTLHTRETR